MKHNIKSVRPFIGSANFEKSRSFYRDFGFDEIVLTPKLSVFKSGDFAFYLQDAYVKDWIDNTMVFMEVADVNSFSSELESLELPAKFEGVRVSPVNREDWGSVLYVHDPCGILWHIGEFSS